MTRPDPPVVWWLFPSIAAAGLGLLVALSVRLRAAEAGAEMQRRCETHCTTAGLGHGVAEPKADACVCDDGGSQP